MEPQLLFEAEGYQICKEYRMTEEMIELLEHTVWGTNKTLYHHYYNREHLLHVPDPYFFTARREGRLKALVVFCRRRLRSRGQQNRGIYIRYFAAGPEMKGKGLVGRFSKWVMEWAIQNEAEQAVFYALIEGHNKRVRNVVESVGFRPLSIVKTIGFSRFFPRSRGQVRALGREEFDAFLPRLEAFYSDYAFWMADNLNIENDYFVLEEEGRIIAGAQVHLAHWAIEKLPGFTGKVLVPLLPYLPLFRRIFNPRDFRFLTFEALYAAPGHEHRLPGLLESLLHRYKRCSAIFWLDQRDPLLAKLLAQNQLGLLHHFVKGSDARFIGNFKGFPEDEMEVLKQAPAFISGHDNI